MNMMKKCSLCHLPAGLSCSRCLQVYCSFACQVQDWSEHRKICLDIPLTGRKLHPADSYLEALTDGGMLPPRNSVATERTSRKSLASIPSFIRSLTPLRKPHFCMGGAVGASVNGEAKALPPDVKRESEGSPPEKTRNITVTMDSERRKVTMKVIENAIKNLTLPVDFTAIKPQMADESKQEKVLTKHTKADKAADAVQSIDKIQWNKQLRGINGQVDPEAKSVSQSQQPPNPDNRGCPEGPMNRGHGPPPSPIHIQKILIENASLIQSIQFLQNLGKANECISYHEALHRNLVYLANLPDPQHIILALLPPFQVLQHGSSGPLMRGALPNGTAPGSLPGYEEDPKHGPQAQTPGFNQLALPGVASPDAVEQPSSQPPTSQANPPPPNQQPVDSYREGPQAMPQQNQGYPPQRGPYHQHGQYPGYPPPNQPYQSQPIYPLYGLPSPAHGYPPNAPQSYHHGGMPPTPSGSGPQGGPQKYGPPMGGQYPPQAAGIPPMAHTYPDYGIPNAPNAYSHPPPGYPPIRSQPSYNPPQQQYPFNYPASQPVPHGPPSRSIPSSASINQTNPPASFPSTQTSDAPTYTNQSCPDPGQTSSPSPSANALPPSTQYQQSPCSCHQSASGGSQGQGPPPGFGPVYPPHGCYQQGYSLILPPQGYQYQRPPGGQMPSPGPQGPPPQGAYSYGYEQLRCRYYFSK